KIESPLLISSITNGPDPLAFLSNPSPSSSNTDTSNGAKNGFAKFANIGANGFSHVIFKVTSSMTSISSISPALSLNGEESDNLSNDFLSASASKGSPE